MVIIHGMIFFFFFFFFFSVRSEAVVSHTVRLMGCLPAPAAADHPDARSLLEFKSSVLDPHHKLSSWHNDSTTNISSCNNASSSSSHDPCQWSGVLCQHQRVVSLNLSALGLQGSLPPSLAQLPFLSHLYLSSNAFSGSIPPQLGNCTFLSLLDLSNNHLTGVVPPELGLLNSLETLYLYGNILTGEIPKTLANCTALKDLDLDSNRLEGSIPAELGTLKGLQALDLHTNQLSQSIPPELGMLKGLQFLDLFTNNLMGGLPGTLGNCTVLTTLDLSANLLTGSIPSELGMLKRLQLLHLFENKLTGGVPTTLRNCTALTNIDLDSNQLSGSIPAELGVLEGLQELQIRSNRLAGGVPATLANCTALERLSFADNQLTGGANFLTKLFNLTRLQILNLSFNNFTGVVPDGFDRFANLVQLGLAYNYFTGTLPHSLGELEQLTWVYLEGNLFEGSIPNSFVTSLLLQQLNVAFNNLSGTVPDSFGGLLDLLNLDLSYNILTGPIPLSLGSLQQLQSLDLSNNKLSGSIPATLSSCVQLVSLNLSNNKFGGYIPESLGKLQSLNLLDLSYNHLNGAVPNMRPFDNTSITYLTGNPGLCGQIVHRACAISTPPNNLDTFSNRTHILRVALSAGLAGMLILGIWLCWYCSRKRPSNYVIRGQYLNVKADDLVKATNSFSEENVIGAGSVGTVYRAVLPGTGKAVAVKLLKNQVALHTEDRFTREVQLLAKVRHRNIVRVCGCCFNLDMKAIILELMPNGSLEKYLHGIPRLQLSTDKKMGILRGVANALEYLHHRHPEGTIVHGDIKPENILLDADLEPRITDFGVAKLLNGSTYEESASLLLRGSVGYIPPEYGHSTRVSTKGDVYSFGVVILEVLTGKRPICSEQLVDGTLVEWVRASYPNEVLSIFDTEPRLDEESALRLAGVALMCTHDLPSRRPTMLEISKWMLDIGREDAQHTYPALPDLICEPLRSTYSDSE